MPRKDGTGPSGNGPKRNNKGTPAPKRAKNGGQGRAKGQGRGRGNR